MLRIISGFSRRINVAYLALFGCFASLYFARYASQWYKEGKLLWYFGFIGIAFLFNKCACSQNKIVASLQRVLISKTFVFLSSLGVLTVWFIASFPLREWTSYILFKDYPVVFAVSKQGWEILRQGGYFGWSNAFVGGYFTVADMGLNVIHFLWPFTVFGWNAGFHALLLFLVLCFPVLCFFYIKTFHKADETTALISVPVASAFVLTYYNDLLWYGMVAALIAVDLIILALIFFERLKENGRFSFLGLLVALSLLLYTHPGIFSFCIMIIVIDALYRPSKKSVVQIALLMVLLAVIGFLPLLYATRYSGYLNIDPWNYDRASLQGCSAYVQFIKKNIHTLLFDIAGWRKNLSGGFTLYKYPLFFLPILIYMFFKGAWRKHALLLALLTLISVAEPPRFEHWMSRTPFLFPFLLSVVITGFLSLNRNRRGFGVLVTATMVGLMVFLPLRHYVVRHGRPGSFYNLPLVKKIKTLSGPYILIEHNQSFLGLKNRVPSGYFWLPLLQMETGQNYFANMRGGYHFTAYRGNTLESGFFRNKPIDQYVADTINPVIQRWGIRYLAVWSGKSKRFFSRYPEYYKKVWEDPHWMIFEYRFADSRSAVAENSGSAEVMRQDYFSKTILLRDVNAGEKITVRSNFFPEWKAYYNKHQIPLFERDGQVGFIAPATGTYTLRMEFPRYTIFYIVTAATFLLVACLSYGTIVP